MTRIACIADTHGMHNRVEIPDCDLIIHAGDLSNVGEISQLESFNEWAGQQAVPVIATAGNHDKTIRRYEETKELFTNCELLIDSSTIFNGLKIYGSPWSPWFGGEYWVYNAHRGEAIRKIWAKIPDDTDVLITHGPPRGILDRVPRVAEPQGCLDLLDRVRQVKPKLHVFGHLHSGGGQKKYLFGSDTVFVNASVCTESYDPVNPPIVVTINED